MTCKEKLIADHPDWTEERIVDYLKNGCPSDCGYLEDPTDEDGEPICYTHCSECWDREIPETDIKKENEEMKVCVSICEEKTRLIEELKNTRERLAEVTECYAESLKERDELKKKLEERNQQIRRLNQINEDLANKLAREKVCVEKLDDLVKIRDEEIEKLVKENEGLRVDMQRRDDTITGLCARYNEHDDLINAIAEKNEEIMNLRAEKDAMAAGKAKALAEKDRIIESRIEAINKLRIEVDILRAEKETQAESIKDLLKSNDKMKEDIELRDTHIKYICDKNKWLNDQVDAKNKRIQELCARIDKLDKARYIEQDITMTKELYELFRQARPIVIPKEEPIIRPFNELPYVRYARHIRMKYKALTDNGFSHDDAMALIPMWDDKELNGFKLKGDTNK